MPKNKKPAGGRAQNFEPRYGKKTSYQDAKRRPGQSSAGTAGSKSPNHRGYRAPEEGAASKGRWTEQDRAGRAEARGIRSHARGDRSDDRPRRDDRGERPRFDRNERPARSFDDRPRRDDRGERPRFDRSASSNSSDSARRPARGTDPRRSGAEVRSYDRNDRPARSFDDRPRRDDRGDRPRYDRNDRPARSFDDRPRRDDRGDRPRFDRNDRPARSFDDRPRRDDRPARSFDDRPRRDDRGDRPRFDRSDRPARSFDDRPRRDERANRSDWNAAEKAKAHQDHVDVVHERLQAEAVDAASVEQASFADLGLGQNIVRTLEGLGASSPFPIQAATVRPILEGRDVLARGRTGSGKTIAFGAPLVERVLRGQAGKRRAWGRSPQALILAPTRELALQIDRTVQELAQSVGLFTTQVYGGVPQGRQVGALKKGVDIVIGTPGRIEDLEKQGKLDLSEVGIVVLDEADHMSELGFLEPMQRILRLVQDDAQKLLFSATLDREVAALVDEFLVDPAVYEVAGETQETGTIDHRVLVIDHRDKAEILASLVDRDGKTLVFTRTRAFSEMLVEQFEDAGIAAVALHGDLNQAKRTRNLQRLTDGKVNVLVATDVAARGIHVDDIDLVVQADAPDEYKTYTHRSGRTGRAGRSGTVVTLITRQRRRRMTEMLERAEIDAPFEEVRAGDDVLEELSGRQAANVDA
ncbi:DEAD/DEAH box helicase [Microbacterium sp. EYE_5]|uniref:DEAD/DEAH box helicase n=1 Tax=unclassified Microbacterium TaxID=2609290 RepID=UPI002002B18B|nr:MULTISPECIES: DEAD/DEAH box helicase [unclassified Microbacterium]MCK6079708.1 DEAD/DEAH box helicase [Microbacterium sp. EYE_382]MCK6084979.1 DEAD/DEAH box helicase [Microbacterium sp. EYE_384]MCK6122795.1 DEAD/DEAH box helicase [Microbacterium sp. EYE_80]MCK6125742.1 DEAD/DEAH box helicase [Microbacterium sp. EYE_79]MCK6140663.1 DEAD/DEAH box helicase [Microbacterium sp. EYE_39]